MIYTRSASPGDPRRLSLYRQVFDLFIQEFKTYQNILSDVKNEYEAALQNLERQSELVSPLKAKLAILRFENIQEMNQQTAEIDSTLAKFRYSFCLLQFNYIEAWKCEIVESARIDSR